VFTHAFEDSGTVCFETPTIAAGGAIALSYVKTNACLSSSCTRQIWAGCRVERSGRIRTTARWKFDFVLTDGCTTDCNDPQARCETPPLSAGTHDFTFGDQRATIVVPSTAPQRICLVNP
jgi:hypothetical protein